jgi:hypothetical protein
MYVRQLAKRVETCVGDPLEVDSNSHRQDCHHYVTPALAIVEEDTHDKGRHLRSCKANTLTCR